MGGQSSSTQTQQSQTAPWEAAQPMLQNILGQLQTNLGNTGITGQESTALNTLEQNASTANQYAPAISEYAKSLLAGGGATNQAGSVNQNYLDYVKATQPLASNTDYNPYNTPGFKNAIDTMSSDISSGVNGQFAAAGRDFSGANSQALTRGLAQGLAPVIQSQYNQNIQNQQGAANSLYNAGNTNAGIQAGLQQQYLANQGQGVTAAGQANDSANAVANATLAAEAQRRGIPVQALGLLAQIGVPIAGLGGQSSGTSSGTQEMSGAQQFATIAGGIGNLLTGFAKFSDRRLKEDIEPVGALFDGTPVYGYRYKGAGAYHIGLMAQDVEKTTPHAVVEINGYKAVNYYAATEASRKISEAR
jgi:hypothetical protein